MSKFNINQMVKDSGGDLGYIPSLTVGLFAPLHTSFLLISTYS